MKKVFTIIKADSERVPKKNFLKLGRKPMWKWLLEELSDFDVYVNTDSEELIEELASYSHITPICRSQKHIDWELRAADIGSPVMDMVKEFCEVFLADDEIFALVHITSPFLKSVTLAAAFDKYEQLSCHSIHSVKKIQDFTMSEDQGGIEPMNFSFDRVSRTQDLKPYFQSLGAFFVLNSKKLNQENYRRLTADSVLFPLSSLEAVEVDTPEEFEFAKLIASALEE
jgi:CMP-N-acetylneuraminic acid synthetase